MLLKSEFFKEGGNIPAKYTCQGIDISPPLIFEEIPDNTLSLALLMEDPDVPLNLRKDGLWVHWILYNLDAQMTFLEEGEKKGVCGFNTGGTLGYMGPCPPDRKHRYFFTLYALDRLTDFQEGLSRSEFLQLIEPHVIEKSVLMGTYEKF
ncbi:MAG: YbhB/YbcL family Raf kinase inhibitor-like protein [Victivallaceae bacterium]